MRPAKQALPSHAVGISGYSRDRQSRILLIGFMIQNRKEPLGAPTSKRLFGTGKRSLSRNFGLAHLVTAVRGKTAQGGCRTILLPDRAARKIPPKNSGFGGGAESGRWPVARPERLFMVLRMSRSAKKTPARNPPPRFPAGRNGATFG